MKFTGERFIPVDSLPEDEIGYEHLHRYHAAATVVKHKTVLDIACGEGYGSAILAGVATSVTGVDIDKEIVQWATGKYTTHHPNLQFIAGTAENIPFPDNTFDVVISFETIEHLNDTQQEAFVREIKRVLNPDGVLLMSTPAKKNYTDRYQHSNKFHVHEFYRDEFVSFIKKHFIHTAFFEQGFEVVSIINNSSTEKNAAVQQFNWNNTKHPIERKYVIAAASAVAILEEQLSITSIVPSVNKEYLLLMDSLTSMNGKINDLELRNHQLDDLVLQQATDINNQATDIKKQVTVIKRMEQAFKLLDEQSRVSIGTLEGKLLEEIFKTDQLQQKLLQVYHEANTVKERLEEIYGSDGWQLLDKYYRVKAKLLPEHSPRYKKLKKLYNRIRFKRATAPAGSLSVGGGPLILSDSPVAILPFTLPAYENPAVSIIIPAYNAWTMNYKCISSIHANTTGVSYEVILADDGSTDDTSTCTTIISNLVHIRTEQNLGFLKNCNYAAGFAKGKYMLFLNNDTHVMPNWLSPMFALMERDKKVGMVGAKLLYPDGRLQEAGGIIWNDASGWNYGHRQDPQLPAFNYVKEVDYVSGACIMVRGQAWEEAGGFDERYSPAYCEDSDLAFTLRRLHYKVMYQPLSQVIHFEGYSHGTDATVAAGTEGIKAYQQINNKKFFEKWQAVLQTEQLPNGEDVFHARDRSTGKKTVLVIDHYVPHYDRDAGSKTTFQYLELFLELGLQVKFIGDNFFKHEPYTGTLEQMGIEVLYGAGYRDNWQQWIKDNSLNIDYIYLNRPHTSIKYIDVVKQHTRALILYYGHDLHFLREQLQYEVNKDPALLKSIAQWKETEIRLFMQSDIILTPSSEERKIIQLLNKSFRVETILPYFFSTPALPADNFALRKNVLFVGGFGHSPNVDAVEWFCREVWPIVVQAVPGINFIVVGSNPPEAIVNLQNDSVIIKGFVPEKELQALYASVKIAVVPLRFGAGVKGKTVEAMYYGLPVLTTSFGVEGMPEGLPVTLKTFNDAQAFATEMIYLYNNESALTTLSQDVTSYINSHFTRSAASVKMAALLNLSVTQ